MVRGWRLLPRDNHVAPCRGVGGDGAGLTRRAGAFLVPGKRTGEGDRAIHPEAQRVRCSGGDARRRFGGIEVAVVARVERGAVGVARPVAVPRRRRDLAAARERRVDQAHRAEPVEGSAVVGHVLGLAAHRLLPGEVKPAQVVKDRHLEFWPAARLIDVLDAQQEAPDGRLAEREVEHGGVGVAEMECAGGRGREAVNGWQRARPGLIGGRPCFSSGRPVGKRARACAR